MDRSIVIILVATIPGQSVSIESDPIAPLPIAWFMALSGNHMATPNTTAIKKALKLESTSNRVQLTLSPIYFLLVIILVATIPGQSVSIESDPIAPRVFGS
jgi:hypothetical protein